MKYLIVFSVIAAVASAHYLKPTAVAGDVAEIQEIIAAINSPSTDPATAAALEQLLQDTLGISAVQPEPVIVAEPSPIAIGPAIIDFPAPDGGALTPGQTPVETPAAVEAPVVPAPAVVAEVAQATPLVQIILNINQAGSEVAAAPVAPAPVEAPVAVSPVTVVDEAVNVESPVAVAPVVVVEQPIEPVQVVDTVPEAVQVVDAVPEPVQVVDAVPEPVQVVEVAPAPVVTLPDILN